MKSNPPDEGDADSKYAIALHSGSYSTRLIIVPKCVLKNYDVTLTAIYLISMVENQSTKLKERFESAGNRVMKKTTNYERRK